MKKKNTWKKKARYVNIILNYVGEIIRSLHFPTDDEMNFFSSRLFAFMVVSYYSIVSASLCTNSVRKQSIRCYILSYIQRTYDFLYFFFFFLVFFFLLASTFSPFHLSYLICVWRHWIYYYSSSREIMAFVAAQDEINHRDVCTKWYEHFPGVGKYEEGANISASFDVTSILRFCDVKKAPAWV